MKSMSNFSIAGMIFGALFSIFSVIRYDIIWPDPDRAIIYAIIGAIIVAVSWMYNVQIQTGNDITAIEDYISDKEDRQKR